MLGYSLFAMQAQADRKSLLQSATEKTPGALPPGTTQRTLAIIMGGGAGTRLFPLTKDRAKPAVPLGGKYRHRRYSDQQLPQLRAALDLSC